MTHTLKSVNVRWHYRSKPYNEYPPERSQYYEPKKGFEYRYDDTNEDFYSILEPKDVRKILRQIRAGYKLEMYRLRHFTDENADCVAEILEQDGLESYYSEFFLIAACHLTHLGSPLIAELMITHRLRQGDTVDEIVNDSPVGSEFYGGDEEGLETDFLPFVEMCNKKWFYEKLHHNLEATGIGKRVPKI
jgi:hypothetical protein